MIILKMCTIDIRILQMYIMSKFSNNQNKKCEGHFYFYISTIYLITKNNKFVTKTVII